MKIGLFLAESPWGDIDETTMNKGLGGRETALVQLAIQWAGLGVDVYAFVPRSDTKITKVMGDEGEAGPVGTVRWIPMDGVIDMAPILGLDMMVSWENPYLFKELAGKDVGRRVVEMQVAHLRGDRVSMRYVDNIAALSNWAGDFLHEQHPYFDRDKIVTLPNGIDINRFADFKPWHFINDPDEGRVKFHFIYSSSPDRGLHHLLKMWRDIWIDLGKEYEIDAELHVCYGAEKFIESSRWSHREDSMRALDIERLIDQEGVTYHGKVGQDVLAKMMLASDALLYPCDTMSPTETGCITVIEACAAGAIPVITDCDCLGSEFAEVSAMTPLPLDYEAYAKAVVEAMHPEDYVARQIVAREFAETRDWSIIAKQWIEVFSS
jgi:glycosyltransferase involved in cell wall biosynthesis